MYQKFETTKLNGLNSAISPTLMPDDAGYARDIYNLRQEKIGKLYSRDGNMLAAFTIVEHGWQQTLGHADDNTLAYVFNLGMIGIGEMVLSDCAPFAGTDKLMVYYVRGRHLRTTTWNDSFIDSPPVDDCVYNYEQETYTTVDRDYDHRNDIFASFLFVPADGPSKGTILFDNEVFFGNRRDMMPEYPKAGMGQGDLELAHIGNLRKREKYSGLCHKVDMDPQGDYTHTRNLYAPMINDIATGRYSDLREVSYKNPDGTYSLKTMPSSMTIGEDELEPEACSKWIDQHVDMNQYSNMLIVSDRLNGDMVVENMHDVMADNQCCEADHKLHIRPNCLHDFNVDIVNIDACLGLAQENGKAEGVEHGMGLYAFKLPKATLKVTEDNASNILGDPQYYPKTTYQGDGWQSEWESIKKRIKDNFITSDTFANLFDIYNCRSEDKFSRTEHAFKLNNDNNKEYVFSNQNVASEFSNVEGKLEFEKDKTKDKDGNQVEEYSANVYVWEDYKVKYYPCNGKTKLNEIIGCFLKYIDRDFKKVTAYNPKVKTLKVQDEIARDVPLSVWRYRFVWDFGNGIYSAPSAEVSAPDLLWSATKDSVFDSNSPDYSGVEYKRYVDGYKTMHNTPSFSGINSNLDYMKHDLAAVTYEYPTIVSGLSKTDGGTYTLSKFGEQFLALKKKLFPEQHRFGAGKFNGGIVTSIEAQNFSTLITVRSSKGLVQCHGTFWEGVAAFQHYGAAGDVKTWTWSTDWYSTGELKPEGTQPLRKFELLSKHIMASSGRLNIPMFKIPNQPITYNSVFDDEGRVRIPYTKDGLPCYAIVYPGYNLMLTENKPRFTGELPSPYAMTGYGLIYNQPSIRDYSNWSGESTTDGITTKIGFSEVIYGNTIDASPDVCLAIRSTFADKCNASNYAKDTMLPYNRWGTYLRGTKNEQDSFLVVNADIPQEASSRLVLQGMWEFKIPIGTEFIHTSETNNYIEPRLRFYPNETEPPVGTNIGNDAMREWVNFATYQTLFPKQYTEVHAEYDDKVNPFMPVVYSNMLFKSWANVPPVINYGKDEYATANFKQYRVSSNLGIYVYQPAERFVGPEQLTAYFPSSLLFKSPRLGIYIKPEDVPAKAKKLLVFRTMASHSNGFDPTQFGLVDEIDIDRIKLPECNATAEFPERNVVVDYNGFHSGSSDAIVKIGPVNYDNYENQAITYNYQGDTALSGLYYFDDTRDDYLDFSRTPDQYEGRRRSIHSRFNLPMNERMFYFNFKEYYQPISPRRGQYKNVVKLPSSVYLKSSDMLLKPNTKSKLEVGDIVEYLYVYKDATGIVSKPRYGRITIEGGAGAKYSVIHYMLPHPPSLALDRMCIYSRVHKGGIPATDLNWYLVEEVKFELDGDDIEGIVVDSGKRSGVLDCAFYDDVIDYNNPAKPTNEKFWNIPPNENNYESGYTWSEPYRPDWIKLENFAELRSGDGGQITGVSGQYGNLNVFKDTSVHRLAVQADGDIPVSRTDEVDASRGCVAPHTLVNVNNILYFLDASGWMNYDGNLLRYTDDMFTDELQEYLKTLPGDTIRYASSCYNPYYKEVWLTLPFLPPKYRTSEYFSNNEVKQGDLYYNGADTYVGKESEIGVYQRRINFMPETQDGVVTSHLVHERSLLGNIYVYNPTKQYATKFGGPTISDYYWQAAKKPTESDEQYAARVKAWDGMSIDPLQACKIYKTNSLGEVYSADIRNKTYGGPITKDCPNATQGEPLGWMWAGVYIDTPRLTEKMIQEINIDPIYHWIDTGDNRIEPENVELYSDCDQILNGRNIWNGKAFPNPLLIPVESVYKTKFFTFGSETTLKRIRETLVNIYSRWGFKASGVSIPLNTWDDGVEDEPGTYHDRFRHNNPSPHFISERKMEYTFKPTEDLIRIYDGALVKGTNTNVVSFVPAFDEPVIPYDQTKTYDLIGNLLTLDDYGKAIKYSVEIESKGRTVLNSIGVYSRNIQTYLR